MIKIVVLAGSVVYGCVVVEMKVVLCGLVMVLVCAVMMGPGVAGNGGMEERGLRIRGVVYASLVGDALGLGTHYEYSTPKILELYGNPFAADVMSLIGTYFEPGQRSGGKTHGVGWGARRYHDKPAGDQTDYGDYLLVVGDHLARAGKENAFDGVALLKTWQRWMKRWKAWMCTQTKITLQQVERMGGAEGAGARILSLGGNSNAMALRSHFAFAYFEEEEELVAFTRMVAFTHQNAEAHMGSEYVVRVAHRIVHRGMGLREAVEDAARDAPEFIRSLVASAVAKVAEVEDGATSLASQEPGVVDDIAITSMARLWEVGKSEPIKVGKASPTEGVLPAALYLALRYEGRWYDAVKANAVVGGDTGSRAVVLGMLMGGCGGGVEVGAELLDGLVVRDDVEKLLSQAPLLQQRMMNDKDEL